MSQLFEPSASVDEKQRPRVRLLSIYLLLISINTFSGVYFLRESIDISVISMFYTGIILIAGYFFSRSQYYIGGMVIGIVAPALPSVIIAFINPPVDVIFRGIIWLTIPLLLSSIVLSLRANYIIALSYIVLTIFVWQVVKFDALVLGNILAYMITVFFFVIAVAMVRQRDQSKIESQLRELEISEAERGRLLDRLQDKTKELEQIIFVASHDLRSPLVNIQGFTKELESSVEEVRTITGNGEISPAVKEKLAPYMEEDIPEAIKYVLAGTSKIDSLLSGLLRMSRLGRAALDIQPLNMTEMLRNIVQTIKFTIKNLNISIEVEELPECQGDKTQVNQVFSNLIDNAIKYRDPGRSCFIRITGRTEDGQAIFCVEDNGIGIAEEHRQKVFQIFQRVGTSKITGEGLGLTIVRRILDRQGGKVWLESEIGKGSKFFVSLPAVATVERRHVYADEGSRNTLSRG